MKQRLFKAEVVSCVSLLTLLGSLAGCISAPPKKPNIVEQVKQENAVGSVLARRFEAKLHFFSDPVVDAYLQKLGSRLEKISHDPRLAGTEVVIIQDRGDEWRSFSIPGRRVYLSLGWAKETKTDSELAALIALELGHIQDKHVLNHLSPSAGTSPTPDKTLNKPVEKIDEKKMPDFFGAKGLFTYNREEMEAAVRSAVGILYKSGFDSRGLISMIEVEKKNVEHSSFTEDLLNHLIQVSREAVDSYPPLINPIVRTQEFLQIRKRIEKL
jgi:predicted Zn-dependent protease